MKQLSSIEFVFDASYRIDIPVKYFGYVNIDQIRDVTKRYAMNCVATVKQAGLVEFVIFKEANKEIDYMHACTAFGCFQAKRDITHILLHYENGSIEKLYVEMKGTKDNWLENEYQHVSISNANDLYLAIGENASIADINKIFPVLPEEIERLRKNICTSASDEKPKERSRCEPERNKSKKGQKILFTQPLGIFGSRVSRNG